MTNLGSFMQKRAIIAAIMLAGLTGFGGPSLSKNQKAEVENIAEDFANGAPDKTDTSGLEERIEDLEQRMKISEGADTYAINNIDRLSKQNIEDSNAAAELEKRINKLRR